MKKILFPVLLLGGTLLAQTGNLNQGLIGAYTFDKTSDTTVSLIDTSGTNTAMTVSLHNVAAPDRFGDFNAISLSSKFMPQGLSILQHQPLPKYPRGNSPRSFSLWFRKDVLDLNFESATQFLMFYGAANTNIGCGIAVDYLNNTVYFAGYQNDLIINYPISLGTWHHLVASYDGNMAKIYMDGNVIDSMALNWNTHTSGLPHYGYLNATIPTGGSQIQYHNAYTGSLDDILIYDRALNATEVNSLFTGNPISNPIGLFASPMMKPDFLYPDPSSGTLYFENVNDISAYSILSLTGQVLWESEHVRKQLDIGFLPNGTYVFSFVKEGTSRFIKFTKQ